MRNPDKFKGCLIGGAAGDALGYAVEFSSENDIERIYGKGGITQYELVGDAAQISDDTQMTLFTAAGLLTAAAAEKLGGRPDYIAHIRDSYMDWLRTQTEDDAAQAEKGCSWLAKEPELFQERAPGLTCLNALSVGANGTVDHPINQSKGCGGIMRVAPIGLYFADKSLSQPEVDLLGAGAAALTHGHELGYIPAAVLVHIISLLAGEEDCTVLSAVEDAMDAAKALFPQSEYLGTLLALLEKAILLAQSDIEDRRAIYQLGEGWVAEETLAIAVYCALKYPQDIDKALIAAVNHGGDSDSTGAVTGNILGAALGLSGIPQKYIDELELKDMILSVANDLYGDCGRWTADDQWRTKYTR